MTTLIITGLTDVSFSAVAANWRGVLSSQRRLLEVCVEIVQLGDLLVGSSDPRGVIPYPQKLYDRHVAGAT